MNSRKQLLSGGSPDFISKDDLKDELNEFGRFAFKKNLVELTLAVILGTALNNFVKGMSESLFMPIINTILNNTGKDWRDFYWEPITDMKFEVGHFLGTALDFLVTAIVLYIIFVKMLKPIWNYFRGERNEKCYKAVPIRWGCEGDDGPVDLGGIEDAPGEPTED